MISDAGSPGVGQLLLLENPVAPDRLGFFEDRLSERDSPGMLVTQGHWLESFAVPADGLAADLKETDIVGN